MDRRAISLLRGLVAVVLVSAATALNIVLAGPLNGPTLLFPVSAVTLAALYGGIGTGLFAGALALAAHAFFVLEPRHSFAVAQTSSLYRLLLLAVVGALTGLVAGSLRRAVSRARAEQARAEENAASLALSHALATALAGASTQDEVASAVFERGFAALGANTMLVTRLEDSDHIRAVRAFGFSVRSATDGQVIPLSSATPYAEAIREGRPSWVESRDELARRYPDQAATVTDSAACACLPFASEGRVIGSFWIGFAQARRFSEMERGLLESLATTCGQALERARLFEAERAARLRAETAEAEARRVGELQELFVAVVSHDLRNPLGAMVSGTGLLSRDEALSDQQRSIVAGIRKSAARMERLVRDLLDFTRGRRAFEIPTHPESADMQEIVQQAVLEVRGANPDPVIRVSSVGEQGGVWDPARLGQVVSNLLSNAIQHGGRSSAICVRSRGMGAKVVLEVESTGPAIAVERLPSLFDPFQQGAESQGGHLGLGLFIVREIVRAHGGTITARSTPEGVTTITVELPRG